MPRDTTVQMVVWVDVLLGVLLGVAVVWRRRSAAADETPTPVVSVKVAKAVKDTIAAEIVAVGTISPREKSDVGAKISAQIKKKALPKKKGVRAREVIARP